MALYQGSDPNTVVAHGELQGSTTAAAFPTVACNYIRIVARSDNAGSVYIGVSSSVTKPDGTTDTTTGLELTAGVDSGWIPVRNANSLYYISDNAGDDLTYLCIG